MKTLRLTALSGNKFQFGDWVGQKSFFIVLLISGFFGFLAGILYATPQYIIESARIISGVEFDKMVWKKCIGEEWLDVHKKFGVTEILTYADWDLKLPVKAKSNLYVLYVIPFEQ